jgi:CHAT domain-containing protein/tetratricopeptide (TPR) repeat protein
MKFEATKSITHFFGVTLLLGLCTLMLPSDIVATPVTQQADQAATALRQGRRLLKRGKSDQALGQLKTALNLYTAANNNRGIAAAHNELGDLYLRQGQYNVALDHYKKAFEGFIGAAQKQDVVTMAVGLADDQFNANLMLAKIGDINFRLGRIPEASAAYGQMVVKKPEGAAKKAGGRFGGLGAIAGGLSTGSVSVAAPTSALTIAMEVKKELDEYRNSIVYSSNQLGLGRIAYHNNDLETAKKNFQSALEATSSSLAGIGNLGQTRRFRAAARTSLGDVALRQGKFKDATESYTKAVKGAQDDKRLDLMWPAQRGQGRSLWLQAVQEKDPKKAGTMRESAVGNYREAIKTIETLRQGSLHADEARTTFLATTKNVFDEAASSLAEMALIAAPAGGSPLEGSALAYASEAFKITEQARARSLLDLLSETGTSVTEGVPVELLKRKQENLDRQQEIAELLTGINISTDEPKKKPAELEAELDKLQTDFNEIENQIRVASPRYAALTSGQSLSLADVQQKVLDDRTVLLEYSLGPEASYLWAADSKSLTLHRLAPRPALDKLVTDLRSQLIPVKLQRRIVGIDVAADTTRGLGVVTSSEDAAPFIAASSALYKAAVEPVSSLIAEKRLLVVADGGLNYIPFEALVKTAGGDYSSAQYLIKTNEIVYAPSASVIGAIRQQGPKPAGRAMLVIADPVFNSNDARAKGVAPSTASAETRGLGIESALTDVTGQGAVATAESAKMQGLPLARLSGTRTEAEQIARLGKASGAPTDVWLDLDASEANLGVRDVTKYRVLHIATHGLLNAERPQFTGVVLSLVGNKSDDGFLRTDEVFNLRLGSPLVMLSACETGLGKEKRGEGVMGLTRAFLYAGAPTVGVSLWSVADKSTADLMTDFYKRLLSSPGAVGGSPSAAMRNAQLAMITSKKYSAPFYWAPFVLVGDWR